MVEQDTWLGEVGFGEQDLRHGLIAALAALSVQVNPPSKAQLLFSYCVYFMHIARYHRRCHPLRRPEKALMYRPRFNEVGSSKATISCHCMSMPLHQSRLSH